MKKFRIVALLLVMCLASSCFVGGTFAKYATSAGASDTTKIAKWNVTYIGLGLNDTFEVDLFDTVLDSDGTSSETDVSDNYIAPGTTGKFTYSYDISADVAAAYSITYTVTNPDNVPIQFSVDNGDSWSFTLANVENTVDAGGSAADNVTVMWKWDFGEDVDDTEYAGNKDITVKINFSATQVD